MNRELQVLLDQFAAGKVFRAPADLRHACSMARDRPEGWRNHPPVLAVSIGGSNSSAMLAENRDGVLHVNKARKQRNPGSPTLMEEFFDDLLLSTPEFRQYLEAGGPGVGVTIAVAFDRGTPHHPSKVETIIDLVARDLAKDRDRLHFPTRFAQWLKGRKLPETRLRCEGDAPVAHLGGLARCDPRQARQSLLLVCGTGLACADDQSFILPSQAKVLSDLDPDRYPPEICEGGQFQYLTAGKGIYRIFGRALELRAAQSGSSLAGAPDCQEWLASAADSWKPYKLWSVARGQEELPADLEAVRGQYTPQAWGEIQEIALEVGDRAINAIAATLVSTMVDQGLDPDQPLAVFVEGSIARGSETLPALKKAVDQQRAEVDREKNMALPEVHWILDPHHPPQGAPEDLKAVDQTLHGAAAMIFAGQSASH